MAIKKILSPIIIHRNVNGSILTYQISRFKNNNDTKFWQGYIQESAYFYGSIIYSLSGREYSIIKNLKKYIPVDSVISLLRKQLWRFSKDDAQAYFSQYV